MLVKAQIPVAQVILFPHPPHPKSLRAAGVHGGSVTTESKLSARFTCISMNCLMFVRRTTSQLHHLHPYAFPDFLDGLLGTFH